MPQITLEWKDSTHQIQRYQHALLETALDEIVKIGRDHQRCKLCLRNTSVSRVHGAISFKPDWQRFYVRNLAQKNPVHVDGGTLTDGEVAIYPGSTIQFGQMLLQVIDIALGELPSHTQPPVNPAGLSQEGSSPEELSPTTPNASEVQPPSVQAQVAQPQNVAPKLLCPKCKTLQLVSLRNSNCPVCGHFLADAATQFLF